MLYNGFDERVGLTTTLGGSAVEERRFAYDAGHRIVGEYGATTADLRAEYIWLLPEVGDGSAFGGDDGLGGYMPLAVAVLDGGTSKLHWVQGNHLGTPVVTTDANGAITPTGFARIGFPGQVEQHADLYYNYYRDYDPTLGRYVQADPIGLGGDVNPHLYAGANPLRNLDPDGLKKVNLFNPNGDVIFHWGVSREPDRPGVCLVYGHMAPEGIEVWVAGRKQFLRRPSDIKRELVKRGCKPKEPVYFLGCRAGFGKDSIAERYARAHGLPTVGSTRFTWWSADGFQGSYGRQNPTRGQPGYDKANPNDPGRWRAFRP